MKNTKLIDAAPTWDLTEEDIDSATQLLRVLLTEEAEQEKDVGKMTSPSHPVSKDRSK